jgi:hypothetical protein
MIEDSPAIPKLIDENAALDKGNFSTELRSTSSVIKTNPIPKLPNPPAMPPSPAQNQLTIRHLPRSGPPNLTPWQLTPEQLISSVEAILKLDKAPSIGIAMISPRGRQVVVKGVRKYGTTTPVTQNDQFVIGLVSSVMTATVLGRFIDRGLLSWSSTLAEALPEYSNVINPGHHNTTLAMLGSHHSGITLTMQDAEEGKALVVYIIISSVRQRWPTCSSSVLLIQTTKQESWGCLSLEQSKRGAHCLHHRNHHWCDLGDRHEGRAIRSIRNVSLWLWPAGSLSK